MYLRLGAMIGNQARRLLSMSAIYDGMDRACAAGIDRMDRQPLRDWVHRFNAGGPAGLIDRKPNGALRRLTPSQMAALSRAIDARSRSRTGWGRALALHRSQATDPRTRFGVDYHERSVGISAAPRSDVSQISARPQAHAGQHARAQARNLKKSFPEHSAKIVAAHATGHAHRVVGFKIRCATARRTACCGQWAPDPAITRAPAQGPTDLFGVSASARSVPRAR